MGTLQHVCENLLRLRAFFWLFHETESHEIEHAGLTGGVDIDVRVFFEEDA